MCTVARGEHAVDAWFWVFPIVITIIFLGSRVYKTSTLLHSTMYPNERGACTITTTMKTHNNNNSCSMVYSIHSHCISNKLKTCVSVYVYLCFFFSGKGKKKWARTFTESMILWRSEIVFGLNSYVLSNFFFHLTIQRWVCRLAWSA